MPRKKKKAKVKSYKNDRSSAEYDSGKGHLVHHKNKGAMPRATSEGPKTKGKLMAARKGFTYAHLGKAKSGEKVVANYPSRGRPYIPGTSKASNAIKDYLAGKRKK